MVHQANIQNTRIQYGHVATIDLCRKYTYEEWERATNFSMTLWVCDTLSAPEYNYMVQGTVTMIHSN